MNSKRDQELFGFVLGELGVFKRLEVRARLAWSGRTRRRLAELERVTGAVAGAIGVGGVAGFSANKRVKRRRLLFVDLAVAALMLSTLCAGSVTVWRAVKPPVKTTDACPTDAAGNPILSSPSAKPHAKKHAVMNVQPAS